MVKRKLARLQSLLPDATSSGAVGNNKHQIKNNKINNKVVMGGRAGAGALVGRDSPERTSTASRDLYVLANAWR